MNVATQPMTINPIRDLKADSSRRRSFGVARSPRRHTLETSMLRSGRISLAMLLLLSGQAASQEIDFTACKYEFDATNAALGMRERNRLG